MHSVTRRVTEVHHCKHEVVYIPDTSPFRPLQYTLTCTCSLLVHMCSCTHAPVETLAFLELEMYTLRNTTQTHAVQIHIHRLN